MMFVKHLADAEGVRDEMTTNGGFKSSRRELKSILQAQAQRVGTAFAPIGNKPECARAMVDAQYTLPVAARRPERNLPIPVNQKFFGSIMLIDFSFWFFGCKGGTETISQARCDMFVPGEFAPADRHGNVELPVIRIPKPLADLSFQFK